MKYTIKLMLLFFAALMLARAVNAESPLEQLNQMVEQLRKSPNDDPLRKQIIKLALSVKPAPVIPEEARRHYMKGVTLQKDAQKPEDYDLPIQEYRQALQVAPWWSIVYSNLATALEHKKQYAEAIQNLNYRVLSSPEGPDARASQDKIYALEAMTEVTAKKQAEAEKREFGLMVKIPGETFRMDVYEVTQAEYEKVMGNNPSHFKNCPDCPVEMVTWYEADTYCRKLEKRLPTEWEWEKAAGAGATTEFYWGDTPNDAYGWWYGNSGDHTHPVGKKKPNSYGLYDMAGNAREWTASNFDAGHDWKVLRGGSWTDSSGGSRIAERYHNVPGARYNNYGFRCAQ